MEKFSQMDLGATILSLVLAAGFVAFGVLVYRLLMIGLAIISGKIKKKDSLASNEIKPLEKGFQANKE